MSRSATCPRSPRWSARATHCSASLTASPPPISGSASSPGPADLSERVESERRELADNGEQSGYSGLAPDGGTVGDYLRRTTRWTGRWPTLTTRLATMGGGSFIDPKFKYQVSSGYDIYSVLLHEAGYFIGQGVHLGNGHELLVPWCAHRADANNVAGVQSIYSARDVDLFDALSRLLQSGSQKAGRSGRQGWTEGGKGGRLEPDKFLADETTHERFEKLRGRPAPVLLAITSPHRLKPCLPQLFTRALSAAPSPWECQRSRPAAVIRLWFN